MRIQTKLTFIVMFSLVCFILIVFLFYYTSIQTTELVNKEKQTILLGIEWGNLINLTNNLLINDWKIEETAENWNKAINKFDTLLNIVTSSVILRDLSEKVIKKLDTIQSLWRLTKNNLKQIQNQLERYMAKKMSFPQRPLLFLYGYYYTKEEERENFYQLGELNRVILNFQKSQVMFTNTLTASARSISSEIEDWKNQILIITVIISIAIVTFLLSFSWIFSKRISRRIALVGKSIERVSKGDFTSKLNIKTNDEFETLSHDYNKFIKALKNNIESVLDFMTDVDTAVSNKLNLPRLLKLIAESALDDTNADGAAILMLDERNEFLKVEVISGEFPLAYKVPDNKKINEKDRSAILKSEIIKIGDTIFGQAVEKDEAIFIKNSDLDDRLNNNLSDNGPIINSLIVVPLKVHKRILGAISIVSTKNDSFLTDLDFTHLKAFADYAAISIENLLNEMKLQAGLLDTIKKSPHSHQIINKVRIYLESNFQYQLMVEDVARKMSISPSHFKKIFKRDMGYTFTNYLNMLRIQKAKELLVKSKLSITEIAYNIGYNDSNYFSTVFKSIEGMSPREYRKKIETAPVHYFYNKNKNQEN
jgi:sigma-B regulation protein RsbU (phosphoserine phosphatase)